MLDLMVTIAVLCAVLGAGAWLEQATRSSDSHLPVVLCRRMVLRIVARWKRSGPLFPGDAVRFPSIRHQ